MNLETFSRKKKYYNHRKSNNCVLQVFWFLSLSFFLQIMFCWIETNEYKKHTSLFIFEYLMAMSKLFRLNIWDKSLDFGIRLKKTQQQAYFTNWSIIWNIKGVIQFLITTIKQNIYTRIMGYFNISELS